MKALYRNNLPTVKELIRLSELPRLDNIEISITDSVNISQAIKNMIRLRHLTLGYDTIHADVLDANLIKAVSEQRALRTLTLIGVKLDSLIVD